MSIISFIGPLVSVFFINSLTVKLTKRKFGDAFPITILVLPIIILAFHYLFKNLIYGIYFIYAILVASIAIFVVSIKDDNYRKLLISNGLILYLFIYGFIYVLSRGIYFYTWDELSHWGPTINQIVETGKMYKGLSHASYPPFIQLFEYTLIKLGLMFEEYNLKFAVHLFNFSILFVPFSERLDGGQNEKYSSLKGIAIFIMAFFLAMGIDAYNSFRSIYIDVTVSMFYAYMLYLLIYDESKYLIALSSFAFIVLKDVCILFIAFTALYIVVSFVVDAIKSKDMLEKFKKSIEKVLYVLIPAGLSYALWHIYKIQAGLLNDQFSMSKFSIYKFFEIFVGKLEGERLEGFRAYYHSILNTNLAKSPIQFTYLVSFIVLILILMTITWFTKREDKIKLFLKSFLYILFTYLIYMLFMMNMYVNIFTGTERVGVASYSRYMSSFVLGIYLITFLFIYKNYEFRKTLIAFYLVMSVILCSSFISQRFDRRINQEVLMDPLKKQRVAYQKLSEKVDENENCIVVVDKAFYSDLVKEYYDKSKGNVELYDIKNFSKDENILSFINNLKNYTYLYVVDYNNDVMSSFVGILMEYIEKNKMNAYDFSRIPANEIINIG